MLQYADSSTCSTRAPSACCWAPSNSTRKRTPGRWSNPACSVDSFRHCSSWRRMPGSRGASAAAFSIERIARSRSLLAYATVPSSAAACVKPASNSSAFFKDEIAASFRPSAYAAHPAPKCRIGSRGLRSIASRNSPAARPASPALSAVQASGAGSSWPKARGAAPRIVTRQHEAPEQPRAGIASKSHAVGKARSVPRESARFRASRATRAARR